MIFLKDKENHKKWVNHVLSNKGDKAEEPREFPCYAYQVAFNWEDNLEEAKYLYEDDLKEMTAKLLSFKRL